MADQAAITPATGIAPAPAAQPAPLKVTDEKSAIEFFKQRERGESPRSPQPERTAPAETTRRSEPNATPQREAEDEREEESQTEAEGSQPDAESSEQTATDQAGDDGEELPDNIDALAEKLGLTPEDLAAYLKVRIKTDDGDEEVTLAELRRSFFREADYTRKTKDLAAQRQAAEEAKTQNTAGSEAWQSKIQDLDHRVKALDGLIGQPPPLSMLDARSPDYDPNNYHLLNGQYQSVRKLVDDQIGLLKSEAEAARQKQAAQVQSYRKEQYDRLLGLVPEFRDKAALSKFEAEAGKRLIADYKFTQPDVVAFFQTFDARHIPLLRDAFSYRASQEGKDKLVKQVKSAPPKLKPGATRDAKAKGAEKYKDAMRLLRSARTPGAKKSAGIALMKLKLSPRG